MKKHLLIFMSILLLTHVVYAQITFQKLFNNTDSASNLQSYDSKATPDGGYVLTGITSENTSNVYHPFIIKVNCQGIEQWNQTFGTTQSTANIGAKVIVTADSGFVIINNVGVYTNYNGLVVRLDKDGNILWQKILNLSSGNDNLTDIKETHDGNFILTGYAKNTPDVSLIKLDNAGNLLWQKTFGNNGQYDEGNALIESNDYGYIVTGRYISMGSFNAFLLKTDSNGAFQWLKCYGDTLHSTNGIDLKQLPNDDIILVGSTTLNKTNYTDFSDNLIIKCNSFGDTIWTRIFNGQFPDSYENVTSVEIDNQGNYILGVATASYFSNSSVPNKMGIAKYSPAGNLISMQLYNDGFSHYPRLSKANDNGYILSGFTTRYSQPVGFRGLLIKLNATLNAGCFEQDLTQATNSVSKTFKVTTPTPVIGAGGTSTTNSNGFQLELNDTTLCESYPALIASFSQNSFCVGDTIQFQADSTGVTAYHWDFGVTSSSIDTSISLNPTFIYTDTGTYFIQLIVSNGCEYDTTNQAIQIKACEPAGLPTNMVWPTNTAFFMPNAFSPNGDNLNDILKPIVKVPISTVEFISMQIVNRWGNTVYASHGILPTWDGTKQGVEQIGGNYIYFIRYKYQGKIQIAKGDVTLIR